MLEIKQDVPNMFGSCYHGTGKQLKKSGYKNNAILETKKKISEAGRNLIPRQSTTFYCDVLICAA